MRAAAFLGLIVPAMSDQVPQEIDRLRDHFHELRKAVDATGVTVAVIQERQKAQCEQMDRIEATVTACTDLLRSQNGRLSKSEIQLAVLNDRASDARKTGRNWGLTAGGVGSAIGAALAYLFKGGQ